MATTDSNGIVFYEDTDSVSPLHSLLNTGQQSVSNAFTSRDAGTAWTAYTPTLTAATTNPNIGTTGTRTGYYTRVGKTIHWRAVITTGGTGVSAGSGAYNLSLPVTPSTSGGQQIVGTGWVYGVAGFKPFVMDGTNGRMIRMDAIVAATYVDNTIGLGSVGHVIQSSGTYQIN